MNNESMTAEQTKKAEIINDRFNALSIDVRSNLDCMQEINNIVLGPELSSEGMEKAEKEAKPIGWFDNIIDKLVFVNNNNCKLKKELNRLRKEFKK